MFIFVQCISNLGTVIVKVYYRDKIEIVAIWLREKVSVAYNTLQLINTNNVCNFEGL